jgi:hypothetical protein
VHRLRGLPGKSPLGGWRGGRWLAGVVGGWRAAPKSVALGGCRRWVAGGPRRNQLALGGWPAMGGRRAAPKSVALGGWPATGGWRAAPKSVA